MKKRGNQVIKVVNQSRQFTGTDIPEISVMLPTYKRPEDLRRTLSGLEKQSIEPDRFEIIVVDDGSGDNTEELLQEFSEETGTRFSYAVLRVNGGPAKARNVGLGMCRGAVVLIIGDDIEPGSLLLENHLLFHQQNDDETYALLGHVSFPRGLKPNAFMRWLEHGGRKFFFNYSDLKPMDQVDPIFFYTCNVSVKQSLLEKSGWFDESFPYASHEDLELGYRLADQGMKLIYDPEAKGYHWHMLSVQGIARRVYLMGYSAALFWQKVNDEGSWLRAFIRKVLAWSCSTPPAIVFWNWLRQKDYNTEKDYPIMWKVLLFLCFFIGLSDSSRKKSLRV